MSSANCSSFVKAILTQKDIFEHTDILPLKLTLLESYANVSLATKLAVMMMIFENANGSVKDKINYVIESFDKILDIVNEHNMSLPEEECIIEKIINDLSEEGEAAISPTNSVAGIEPTTPRINPKKKKIDEDDDGISRD